MTNTTRHWLFAAISILSVLLAYNLGQKNAPWPNDTAKWQTIMPDSSPDPCGDMERHLAEPGNWVGIETQVSDDCGIRFIIELGTGPIEGIELGDVFQDQPNNGPEPTPAPNPFDLDFGTGGAY